MEPPFEKLEGVVSVTSGYAGGKFKNPTYEQVSSGLTYHYGQFCDRDKQYHSATFHYHDEEQRRLAEQSKAEIERSGRLRKPIVTEIKPVDRFYAAEEYHQDFYKTNPDRDRRLNELWG